MSNPAILNLKSILGTVYRICKIIFPKLRYRSIAKAMTSYDMVAEKDEQFFLKLYMHFIKERINLVFGEKKLNILDAGCGQGRITIPLARMGHEVIGIDLAKNAVNRAKSYALEAGVSIRVICGKLGEHLKELPEDYFDSVICTEVLYMLDKYEEIIDQMIHLLKHGGLLILSMRPRMFYVYHSIMSVRFPAAADLVLNESKFLEDGFLNCMSKEEMVSLLTLRGLTDIQANGIGILCGIKGDPQACFSLPSALNKKEQSLLFAMELKLSEKYADCGRYVIISGVKK